MFNKKEYEERGYCKIENVIQPTWIKQFDASIQDICDNLCESSNVEINSKDRFIEIFKNNSCRKQLYILLQDCKYYL